MATEPEDNRSTASGERAEDFSNESDPESQQQLAQFEANCKLLQQLIKTQRTEAEANPLVQAIDQWERDSMKKIQQVAEEKRKLLLRFTDARMSRIESKLDHFIDRLNRTRQGDDVTEKSLVEYNHHLLELKEELSKPSTVKIEHDSTSLIPQIHLIDPSSIDTTATPEPFADNPNRCATSDVSQEKGKDFVGNQAEALASVSNAGQTLLPVIVGPDGGDRFQALAVSDSERIIKLRGSQTDGKVMIMEGEIKMGEGPPLHIHHHEDEYWHVLEGEIEFQVGDEQFIGKAGTWVFGPRSVKHGFRNVNSPGARLEFVFQPAGIEHYFEEISRVIVAREPGWEDRATAVATKYGIEVVGVPDWSKPDWS